jgi:hypothetical protein
VSRGYSGTMPVVGHADAPAAEWLLALSLPAVAAAIAVAAWVTHA